MNEAHGLIISAPPHISKPKNTTRLTMLHVLIALLPCCIAATVFFGYMVVLNLLFCVMFCIAFELLYNIFVKRKWSRDGLVNNSAWNLAPAVTGVILALNLPTYLNIWGLNITSGSKVLFSFDMLIVCFLGSLVAIVMVKMLFGGIGKNFANPAAVARIFLFVAFTAAFSGIYAPTDGIVAVTKATWLSDKNTAVPLLDMLLGGTGSAAVGETCAIAIVIGFIYLSVVRVIDFRIPLIVVASTLVFVLFFDGFLKYVIHNAIEGTADIANPLKSFKDFAEFLARHLLSGGLLFGAVYMATDYSSTPNTFWGRVVFAVGVGLLTAVMRTWSMPEGISFAIVIMNIFTPIINRSIKPKFFGAEKAKTGQVDITRKVASGGSGGNITAQSVGGSRIDGAASTSKPDADTKPANTATAETISAKTNSEPTSAKTTPAKSTKTTSAKSAKTTNAKTNSPKTTKTASAKNTSAKANSTKTGAKTGTGKTTKTVKAGKEGGDEK